MLECELKREAGARGSDVQRRSNSNMKKKRLEDKYKMEVR
jgi:hypothetical protein